MGIMNPFGGRFSQYFPSPLGSFNRGQMAGMDIKRQREMDDLASKERGLAKLQSAAKTRSTDLKELDTYHTKAMGYVEDENWATAEIYRRNGIDRWGEDYPDQEPFTDLQKKLDAADERISELPPGMSEEGYLAEAAEIEDMLDGVPEPMVQKRAEKFTKRGEAGRKITAAATTKRRGDQVWIDTEVAAVMDMIRPNFEIEAARFGWGKKSGLDPSKTDEWMTIEEEATRLARDGMTREKIMASMRVKFAGNTHLSSFIKDATPLSVRIPYSDNFQLNPAADIQIADTPGGKTITEKAAIDPGAIDPKGESPPSGRMPIATKYIEGKGWFTEWSTGEILPAGPIEIENAQAGGAGDGQRDPRTPPKEGY